MNKLSLYRNGLRKKSLSANEMLRKVYGSSKNFMTPRVIEKRKLQRDSAYELSAGDDFEHKPLYGVSIVARKGKNYVKSDASKSFHSITEARDYISSLKHKSLSPKIIRGENITERRNDA